MRLSLLLSSMRAAFGGSEYGKTQKKHKSQGENADGHGCPSVGAGAGRAAFAPTDRHGNYKHKKQRLF